MFSRFSRRGLCFLLALVTLCMCLSPALTQPAEAVAAGVIAGSVAIGATAVVAAMLSGLGVKPGSDLAFRHFLGIDRCPAKIDILGLLQLDGKIRSKIVVGDFQRRSGGNAFRHGQYIYRFVHGG